MRMILQIAVPLLAPLLVYLGWMYFRSRADDAEAMHWEDGPWFWALVVGFVLAIGSLGGWAMIEGYDPASTYETPRFENGVIVPGKMTPPSPANPQ